MFPTTFATLHHGAAFLAHVVLSWTRKTLFCSSQNCFLSVTSTTLLQEFEGWNCWQHEHVGLPDPLAKNELTVMGSFVVLLSPWLEFPNALSVAVTSLPVMSIMASRVHSSSVIWRQTISPSSCGKLLYYVSAETPSDFRQCTFQLCHIGVLRLCGDATGSIFMSKSTCLDIICCLLLNLFFNIAIALV